MLVDSSLMLSATSSLRTSMVDFSCSSVVLDYSFSTVFLDFFPNSTIMVDQKVLKMEIKRVGNNFQMDCACKSKEIEMTLHDLYISCRYKWEFWPIRLLDAVLKNVKWHSYMLSLISSISSSISLKFRTEDFNLLTLKQSASLKLEVSTSTKISASFSKLYLWLQY